MPIPIDPIIPSPDPQRSERVQSQRGRPGNPPVAADGSKPEEDRVELSGSARQAAAEQARLQDQAREVSDVRADRVAQARARLEAGEYDSEEVRSAIADRLLEQFGI